MFKKINKDELLRGSLILFILMNIFNFLNYIFHFSMARMLGPEDYGVLAVLMSFVYIFSLPSEAIQTIIAKYTNKLNINKENGKIKDLVIRGLKKGFLFSLFAFIGFILISIFISSFLGIEFSLFIFLGLIIFYVCSIPILRGVLQGRKKFTRLGTNMIIESFFKVLFSIVFVFLGFKIYGAIVGLILGLLIAFFSIFLFMKETLFSKREKTDFRGIYSYSFPIFLIMISIVLFYSVDIILAKRFFTADVAGKYAVASLFGKMIFFGTGAISKTMFPLTSERHENGGDSSRILLKAFKLIFIISVSVLIIFFFFPELVIKTLFGEVYVEVSNILFTMGLAFALLSVTNLIILYNISINKIKKTGFVLLGFSILLVILLFRFHSNLVEFSLVILLINFLMFIYSLFLLKR